MQASKTWRSLHLGVICFSTLVAMGSLDGERQVDTPAVPAPGALWSTSTIAIFGRRVAMYRHCKNNARVWRRSRLIALPPTRGSVPVSGLVVQVAHAALTGTLKSNGNTKVYCRGFTTLSEPMLSGPSRPLRITATRVCAPAWCMHRPRWCVKSGPAAGPA